MVVKRAGRSQKTSPNKESTKFLHLTNTVKDKKNNLDAIQDNPYHLSVHLLSTVKKSSKQVKSRNSNNLNRLKTVKYKTLQRDSKSSKGNKRPYTKDTSKEGKFSPSETLRAATRKEGNLKTPSKMHHDQFEKNRRSASKCCADCKLVVHEREQLRLRASLGIKLCDSCWEKRNNKPSTARPISQKPCTITKGCEIKLIDISQIPDCNINFSLKKQNSVSVKRRREQNVSPVVVEAKRFKHKDSLDSSLHVENEKQVGKEQISESKTLKKRNLNIIQAEKNVSSVNSQVKPRLSKPRLENENKLKTRSKTEQHSVQPKRLNKEYMNIKELQKDTPSENDAKHSSIEQKTGSQGILKTRSKAKKLSTKPSLPNNTVQSKQTSKVNIRQPRESSKNIKIAKKVTERALRSKIQKPTFKPLNNKRVTKKLKKNLTDLVSITRREKSAAGKKSIQKKKIAPKGKFMSKKSLSNLEIVEALNYTQNVELAVSKISETIGNEVKQQHQSNASIAKDNKIKSKEVNTSSIIRSTSNKRKQKSAQSYAVTKMKHKDVSKKVKSKTTRIENSLSNVYFCAVCNKDFKDFSESKLHEISHDGRFPVLILHRCDSAQGVLSLIREVDFPSYDTEPQMNCEENEEILKSNDFELHSSVDSKKDLTQNANISYGVIDMTLETDNRNASIKNETSNISGIEVLCDMDKSPITDVPNGKENICTLNEGTNEIKHKNIGKHKICNDSSNETSKEGKQDELVVMLEEMFGSCTDDSAGSNQAKNVDSEMKDIIDNCSLVKVLDESFKEESLPSAPEEDHTNSNEKLIAESEKNVKLDQEHDEIDTVVSLKVEEVALKEVHSDIDEPVTANVDVGGAANNNPMTVCSSVEPVTVNGDVGGSANNAMTMCSNDKPITITNDIEAGEEDVQMSLNEVPVVSKVVDETESQNEQMTLEDKGDDVQIQVAAFNDIQSNENVDKINLSQGSLEEKSSESSNKDQDPAGSPSNKAVPGLDVSVNIENSVVPSEMEDIKHFVVESTNELKAESSECPTVVDILPSKHKAENTPDERGKLEDLISNDTQRNNSNHNKKLIEEQKNEQELGSLIPTPCSNNEMPEVVKQFQDETKESTVDYDAVNVSHVESTEKDETSLTNNQDCKPSSNGCFSSEQVASNSNDFNSTKESQIFTESNNINEIAKDEKCVLDSNEVEEAGDINQPSTYSFKDFEKVDANVCLENSETIENDSTSKDNNDDSVITNVQLNSSPDGSFSSQIKKTEDGMQETIGDCKPEESEIAVSSPDETLPSCKELETSALCDTQSIDTNSSGVPLDTSLKISEKNDTIISINNSEVETVKMVEENLLDDEVSCERETNSSENMDTGDSQEINTDLKQTNDNKSNEFTEIQEKPDDITSSSQPIRNENCSDEVTVCESSNGDNTTVTNTKVVALDAVSQNDTEASSVPQDAAKCDDIDILIKEVLESNSLETNKSSHESVTGSLIEVGVNGEESCKSVKENTSEKNATLEEHRLNSEDASSNTNSNVKKDETIPLDEDLDLEPISDDDMDFI